MQKFFLTQIFFAKFFLTQIFREFGLGIWELGFGLQNLGFRIWGLGSVTWNPVFGIEDLGQVYISKKWSEGFFNYPHF